jgi:NAD(P)-dependent dehydrogenase (short-subunit alcohol dehydrogenase family)
MLERERRSLCGKVVIVTGAGRGIGAAAARLFSQAGAHVILTGLHLENLERVGLDPAAPPPLRLQHDVAAPEAWHRVVARVLQEHGRIDVLVNNAGIVVPGRADELPTADVERQVAVNLLGTIHGCRAVLPAMRGRGAGRIVNVGSLGGIMPLPSEATYCATKYGVRGYSFALRAELAGSGVEVCLVTPDSVDTDQLRGELEQGQPALSFVDAPLQADQVARAILRATIGKIPEVLVPVGIGLLTRIAMAFPRLVLFLVPFLRKMGARRMTRMRRDGKDLRKAA